MSKKEINELKSQIEQMQKTIEELEKKELKKNYTIKRVNFGENYYVIDGWFTVQKEIERNWNPDFYYHRSFNYFTTEKEAKKYCNHLGQTMELFRIRDLINGAWKPDWNDNNMKYYISVDTDSSLMKNDTLKFRKPFAFKTPEKRDEFIELVGEDKIKQFLSF